MERKSRTQAGNIEKGAEWVSQANRRVIIDNGAGKIKCSLASDSKPHEAMSAVGRNKKTQKLYIANKLRDELDRGSRHNIAITNPIVRGLWHDTDMLSVIWKQEFTKIGGKKFDESESCLCLTVPPVIPDMVQTRIGEIVFEDFQFNALS